MNISLSNYLTIQEALDALKSIPYSELRANTNKQKRELWCVAKMLQYLNQESHLIRTNTIQADSVDVFIKPINNGHEYKIQVVEIAPKASNSQRVFDDALNFGYSTLEKEVAEVVDAIVKNKESKYTDVDKHTLNLLIYLNPPYREDIAIAPLAWGICIDMELDLDVKEMSDRLSNSKFGTIVLLLDGQAIFLKNSKLS